MTTTRVELKIGKSTYKISCHEKRKESMIELADLLDERIKNLTIDLENTDEKTLLAIAGLMMEEEIKNRDEDEEKQGNKFNEQDMYNMLSENIENIVHYIEDLTKKIKDQ